MNSRPKKIPKALNKPQNVKKIQEQQLPGKRTRKTENCIQAVSPDENVPDFNEYSCRKQSKSPRLTNLPATDPRSDQK